MLTYTERIGPISIVGVSTTRAVGVEVAKGGNVTLDQRDNGFILVGRSRQWKADRERQKQRDSSHVPCPPSLVPGWCHDRLRLIINEIGIVWHMNASGILLLPRSGLVQYVFCDLQHFAT